MSIGKLYGEDIIGGAITSIVGTAIIAISQQHGPLNIEIFLLIALLLFGVFYLVKFLTRWMSFLFLSGLREASGLFIEIYLSERNGNRLVVIAPMIVYFDVRADTLAITGHAFQHGAADDAKFHSYANWQSLAIICKSHKDDFGVFYLHDGELVGEVPDEIPGTTFCRLPKLSAKRCRSGYFCDLVQVNRSLDEAKEKDKDSALFPAVYFEIVRASTKLEKEFYSGIARPIERWACQLKLASPREDAFARFIENHGIALITNEAIERGPIMLHARKMVAGVE